MTLFEELNTAKQKAALYGAAFPMPVFFYLERYGRNLEKEFKKVASLLMEQTNNWFLYKAGNHSMKEGLVQDFITETGKHSELGKEYQGIIFVEFTQGVETRSDFYEFISFLKEEDKKYTYVFLAKEDKDLYIQNILEQFFFVKEVCGEAFDREEELQIICDCIQKHGFTITSKAKQIFLVNRRKDYWQEEDRVENRIENVVKGELYKRLTNDEKENRTIKEEDMKVIMKKLYQESQKKITIGFHMEGGF